MEWTLRHTIDAEIKDETHEDEEEGSSVQHGPRGHYN